MMTPDLLRAAVEALRATGIDCRGRYEEDGSLFRLMIGNPAMNNRVDINWSNRGGYTCMMVDDDIDVELSELHRHIEEARHEWEDDEAADTTP
ncbi:MAG: hypothetical protein ACYSUF_04005 [Planctomycetota bacterium]|jgi:hypothetical protein